MSGFERLVGALFVAFLVSAAFAMCGGFILLGVSCLRIAGVL